MCRLKPTEWRNGRPYPARFLISLPSMMALTSTFCTKMDLAGVNQLHCSVCPKLKIFWPCSARFAWGIIEITLQLQFPFTQVINAITLSAHKHWRSNCHEIHRFANCAAYLSAPRSLQSFAKHAYVWSYPKISSKMAKAKRCPIFPIFFPLCTEIKS